MELPLELISKILDELGLCDKINFGLAFASNVDIIAEVKRKTQPIITYNETDNSEIKTWYKKGKKEKRNTYYESGVLYEVFWYWYDADGHKGGGHRENGPSYIEYYECGAKKMEEWNINGKHHRIGAPAWTGWYEPKKGELFGKKEEAWKENNMLHRVNGPAYQSWYSNGVAVREEWWENGILCKPIINRRKNGKLRKDKMIEVNV